MSSRQITYRGFLLTIHHSGWTRISVRRASTEDGRYRFELPDVLLDKTLTREALDELDRHLQRYALDFPRWLEDCIPEDGVPWEIHAIADPQTRKIAEGAWREHRM